MTHLLNKYINEQDNLSDEKEYKENNVIGNDQGGRTAACVG